MSELQVARDSSEVSESKEEEKVKVKVFTEVEKKVEKEINSFLEEGIEVKFVTQSECISTLEWTRSILVWYEEIKTG